MKSPSHICGVAFYTFVRGRIFTLLEAMTKYICLSVSTVQLQKVNIQNQQQQQQQQQRMQQNWINKYNKSWCRIIESLYCHKYRCSIVIPPATPPASADPTRGVVLGWTFPETAWKKIQHLREPDGIYDTLSICDCIHTTVHCKGHRWWMGDWRGEWSR